MFGFNRKQQPVRRGFTIGNEEVNVLNPKQVSEVAARKHSTQELVPVPSAEARRSVSMRKHISRS